MNKFVVGFLGFWLMTTSVFAATSSSATLALRWVVPEVVIFDVSAKTTAFTQNLAIPQKDLVVASINEQSNLPAGYKITISSDNLSQLKREGGVEAVAYTMKYNGRPVVLTSAEGTTISSLSSPEVSLSKSISISYSGITQDSVAAGSYADIVTFTISAI